MIAKYPHNDNIETMVDFLDCLSDKKRKRLETVFFALIWLELWRWKSEEILLGSC